jgi:hypothetical protein
LENFTENLGNVNLYLKQRSINTALGFPEPLQVYEVWTPKTHLEILREMRKFADVNQEVTVRQIYYHLVSKMLLEPVLKEMEERAEAEAAWTGKKKKKVSAYNLVKVMVKKARDSGFINFSWVSDRTRAAERPVTWSSPRHLLESALYWYRRDWMVDQPLYIEVWLEKRALENIFYGITSQYGVYLMPCAGNNRTRKSFKAHSDIKKPLLEDSY